MKYFFGTLLISVLFMACRNDHLPEPESPVELSQMYSVYFNLNDSTAKCTAHFGSTPTGNGLLPSDYFIRVNSSGMSLESTAPSTPSTGPSYRYENISVGALDRTFSLTLDDGTILSNTVVHNAALNIGFSGTIDTISKSATFVIPFTGGPVLTGEQVSVTIYRDQSNFAHVMAAPGDTQVVFGPSDMSWLNAGPATLEISRAQPGQPLQQRHGSQGGSLKFMVYTTQAIMVAN